MRARTLVHFVSALAASLTLAACGNDAPVAPQQKAPAPTASNSLLGGLVGSLLGTPTTITPLHRNTPLASTLTASQTIGILGGVIAIPGAGVSVVVPPLAVSSPKTITVTAMAGSNVAYEFEPHGTKFNVPLVMLQDLSGTQAQTGGLVNALTLQLGYFPNSTNVTSVTELLTVGVSLPTQTGVATIWHFSGYIWATGRSDDSQQ